MIRLILVRMARWSKGRGWKTAAIQCAAWAGFVDAFGLPGAVVMLYRFGREQLEARAGIPRRSPHVRAAVLFNLALLALLALLAWKRGELWGLAGGILWWVVSCIVLIRELALAKMEQAAPPSEEEVNGTVERGEP